MNAHRAGQKTRESPECPQLNDPQCLDHVSVGIEGPAPCLVTGGQYLAGVLDDSL